MSALPTTLPIDRNSILWAGISWNHTGKHSALAPLSREVAAVLPPGTVHRVDHIPEGWQTLDRLRGLLRKLLHRAATPSPASIAREDGVPYYRDSAWPVERKIARLVTLANPRAVFIEALEEQYYFLAQERQNWEHTRLFAIAHQPPAWWRVKGANSKIAAALDTLIVVAESMRLHWEQFLPANKIVVVPHGVDADFFLPAPPITDQRNGLRPLRAVLSGQWLRDFETLAQVVAMVEQRNLPICFDLIVPQFARENQACYEIAMSQRVRWHASLSDEQLRDVYRSADLLLMIMRDATANNGLLEGMACGLPVLVTDVGGVHDYAQPSFADVFPTRDPAAVIACLEHHLANRDRLPARGAAARQFVEQHLSWKRVAPRIARLLTPAGPH